MLDWDVPLDPNELKNEDFLEDSLSTKTNPSKKKRKNKKKQESNKEKPNEEKSCC